MKNTWIMVIFIFMAQVAQATDENSTWDEIQKDKTLHIQYPSLVFGKKSYSAFGACVTEHKIRLVNVIEKVCATPVYKQVYGPELGAPEYRLATPDETHCQTTNVIPSQSIAYVQMECTEISLDGSECLEKEPAVHKIDTTYKVSVFSQVPNPEFNPNKHRRQFKQVQEHDLPIVWEKIKPTTLAVKFKKEFKIPPCEDVEATEKREWQTDFQH